MRSIRWRLMLVSFLLVLLPVYFLNRYAISSFDRFTSKAMEETMISQAFMLGEQYKAVVADADKAGASVRAEAFASALGRYGDEVQSRLQVLSPRGVVLFDSDPDSLVGADFSGRPEIANAMRGGGYKAAWRLTRDGSRVFYFVPLPIRDGDRIVGIAYVTHHTGQITKTILKMTRDQRLVMAVSILLAVLASATMAQTMTRRLRKLTRAAMQYARGDAPLDLQIRGRDEIGELGRAVTHMADEIEQRNEYNRDFVSTVMHELKTPVTAIKGAVEILEGGALEKEDVRRKFLGNIRYESDRLTRMVGELGELTRLDVEMLRGSKKKTDYCSCVREIVDRLLPTFDEDHAGLDVSLPDETIEAMIVPDRIEQVIANLLDNAFRYTPETGRVKLSVAGQDGEVITTVADTGVGIPSGSIERIFDRFYTTEPKDIPREYGSGLGLAIAKSIVENHQGRIWAESRPGDGSRFVFSLPVHT